MNKLSRSVTGMLMMGAAFAGLEAYKDNLVEEVNEDRLACYQALDEQEATACAEDVGNVNYYALGIAEWSVVIGGIACGVQAYRTIRDSEN